MKSLLRFGAIAFMLLGGIRIAHANLVVDPGFEANSPSWNMGGASGFTTFAHTGTQSGFVNCGTCTPPGDDGFVFQNILNTTLGENLIVSFWLTSDGFEVFEPGGSLSVYFGSILLYTTSSPLASPNSFVEFEFAVAAEGGNMGFVMQSENLSAGTFFIDDVSIAAAVPEPQTGMLLIVGGIGLAAWKRRRTSTAV
jgi:hypothetical protein